jgi:hypothetical protein
MDLRQEFEELKQKFADELVKKGVSDFAPLIEDTVGLFDHFKDVFIRTQDLEEKKALLNFMKEVQAFLSVQSQEITKKTGVTSGDRGNESNPESDIVVALKSRVANACKEIRQSGLAKPKKPGSKSASGPKQTKSKRRDRWLRG